MTKKTKLELTWPGKEERPKLEPRILIEHPDKSCLAATRRAGDLFDNMLLKGDNLLALKALEAQYVGQVKCIYIDPPYNTGSAFSHYDDGLEHSIWLNLINERIEILWRLLDPVEGSIWISIDDREAGYLRVLLDEICGRDSFIASNIWQKRYSRENREAIGDAHEYVYCYATNPLIFKENRSLLELGEKQRKIFTNPDNDPRGPWQSVSLLAQGFRPNQMYEITGPSGKIHSPPEGTCWKLIPESYAKLLEENRVYFGKDGNGVPRRKEFLENARGLVPWTWWPHEEVGHTGEAAQESQSLFGKAGVFATPKPERLIQRILTIASKPGDLVLDSFAGSGTTGAVAHKMGRRWIMVEIGNHTDTHIVPRLQKVIDGTDQGGITKAVNWQGGGGFRYFTLAPSLLEKDRWGNWVIAREYNAAMLAEALCKHLGFTYAPSQDESEYWRHGQSSETDFLYVTTQSLTHEALRLLSEEVGPERSLMVCARAFSGNLDAFPNLTCRKIPSTILTKCEWGRDDYSLNVAALPEAEPEQPESAGPLFDLARGNQIDG